MKFLSILLIAFIGMHCSPKLSPDSGWGNQRWVVVEMKGVPVQQSESRRDAFLNFEVAEKRFHGNGGCNQINGNYTIDKKEIHFGEVMSTKMSCSDIDFETVFISTLSSINHYEVKENQLLLKKNREIMLVLRPR
jgi:heat shock protein HslJ